MKIIFSRKGFDGTAGGCPSPIVEGRPVSLPIPTKMPSRTRYGDLSAPYGDLVTDLTRGRLTAENWCHLDPDVASECLPRIAGWRGALGQVSSAQGHLAKQNVGAGDLFIFWGLFRPVEHDGRWKFIGRPEHRIWGWLQVGDVFDLGTDGSRAIEQHPWLEVHPHVRPGWKSPNVLYLAADQLKLGPKQLPLKGWGTLKHGYRLSATSSLPSVWTVPDWLHPGKRGCGMTYNPPDRWKPDGSLQTAARGQEFVAHPIDSSSMSDWVTSVLMEAAS
ncbi:hypothetical protein [Trinickia fusca]|uniref:Nmad3 family putative nucleotide modification protein n=1 Tax=Trinickia fusca TaxID=2419777 RepID=UPI0011C409F9|nr:hypothetical protein [Trinickia fusca]